METYVVQSTSDFEKYYPIFKSSLGDEKYILMDLDASFLSFSTVQVNLILDLDKFDSCPQELVQLLENPECAKLGFNVEFIFQELKHRYGLNCQQNLDFSDSYYQSKRKHLHQQSKFGHSYSHMV